MKSLFVAWQDPISREWTPVARLYRSENKYHLDYTRGAKRCQGFRGLGRMTSLNSTYSSTELFPFFKNRLIPKSRPEYKSILNWLAIDALTEDPMDILIGTGGIRTTDSFELIPQPEVSNERLKLKFFVRGLRYLPETSIESISLLKEDSPLFLLKDIQNNFDSHAFALRTDKKPVLVGYVPKYFCHGINKLIESACAIKILVKKINLDAPLDMRLLCMANAEVPKNFSLVAEAEDFMPWSTDSFRSSVVKQLDRTSLDLDE